MTIKQIQKRLIKLYKMIDDESINIVTEIVELEILLEAESNQ